MKIILDGENDNSSEIVNGSANDESLDEIGNSNNKGSERKIATSKDSENPSCTVEKELRRQGITLSELVSDNPRLSLDWQPFRWVTQCTCASPIDALTRKYHCWNCGQVFCRRCIDYQTSLPGHYSENKVPVCKRCFKKIERRPTGTSTDK